MTQSEQFDMVIVGGGLSGMSLAHYVSRAGKKVLVLEAEEKEGGCVNTARFPDQKFWLEMGAHTCYNSYSNLIDMAVANGLEKEMVPREKMSLKLFNGSLKGIFSRMNVFQLLGSLPRMFFLKKEGQSVQSFYSRILGKKNYARLFSRLFSAVIVQPADEYAADLFLKRRKTRRKEYPKSFTFTRGMQQLIEAVARQEEVEVRHGAKLEKLSRSGEGYQLELASGDTITTQDLTLAVAPNVAARLLKGVNDSISELLNPIPVQKIHSRAVCLEKSVVDMERLAFVIPVEGPCYSMVTRDVVDNPDYRGFAFHFKEGALNAEEELKVMQDVLGTTSFNVEDTLETRHRLATLKVGHDARVEQIDQLLKKESLYLTGNYFDGLSLEDCVIRSRKEFTRFINRS